MVVAEPFVHGKNERKCRAIVPFDCVELAFTALEVSAAVDLESMTSSSVTISTLRDSPQLSIFTAFTLAICLYQYS